MGFLSILLGATYYIPHTTCYIQLATYYLLHTTWYRGIVGFVSSGDVKFEPQSWGGKLVVVSFSFCVLVLVNNYVAQLTTEAIDNRYSVAIASVEDGVAKKYTFCVSEVLVTDLTNRHPGIKLKTFAKNIAIWPAMDEGRCDAAIVMEDSWRRHKLDLGSNGLERREWLSSLPQTVWGM